MLLDVDDEARKAVELDPRLVLDGAVPRLIDEWQLEPAIWNHVRRAIDDRGKTGQFILTGSAQPTDSITRHTGAGRIGRLRMRTMSLHEAGKSTGAISLKKLLEGGPASSPDTGLTLRDVAHELVMGGWPAVRHLDNESAASAARDYLEEIKLVDVSSVDDTYRDPQKVSQLLHSLARHVATHASMRTLARDAGGSDGPLKEHTVSDYLAVLRRLMIIEYQPAWAAHLRSKYLLRRAAKRQLVDPSLAVPALKESVEGLVRYLNSR